MKWDGKAENDRFIRQWQECSRMGKEENEKEGKNESEATDRRETSLM